MSEATEMLEHMEHAGHGGHGGHGEHGKPGPGKAIGITMADRKSTRLNSSHLRTSRMPSSA